MPEIVIADATCFILLSKIDALGLLRNLYKLVYTTDVVASEFGEILPEWVVIKSITDIQKQQILELQVDQGEASAIALALENDTRVLFSMI